MCIHPNLTLTDFDVFPKYIIIILSQCIHPAITLVTVVLPASSYRQATAGHTYLIQFLLRTLNLGTNVFPSSQTEDQLLLSNGLLKTNISVKVRILSYFHKSKSFSAEIRA